ncbi:MAG: hypothetical protein PHR44_05850 [Candidatus Omnitrophica bacterium]|nr:hypothetical protein [Candidatus Omnitrophota bacterium]
MMKKFFWLMVFITLFYFSALAKEAPDKQLLLELIFPKESTSKMTAPAPKLEPLEVYGKIFVNISLVPDKIERDRYLVEYFLDEQLIHQTTGIEEGSDARFSFGCVLDTAQYENGTHKIIVNFWDKSGPSAIGIKEVVINNKEADE